ncbi:hypothetical protein BKA63DRAFT_489421 [Paraphoma chrysanthemicola]|nr:hypothetical protein BKA63DRAFT_489421 [Paraphoma chrysanthemicola]
MSAFFIFLEDFLQKQNLIDVDNHPRAQGLDDNRNHQRFEDANKGQATNEENMLLQSSVFHSLQVAAMAEFLGQPLAEQQVARGCRPPRERLDRRPAVSGHREAARESMAIAGWNLAKDVAGAAAAQHGCCLC